MPARLREASETVVHFRAGKLTSSNSESNWTRPFMRTCDRSRAPSWVRSGARGRTARGVHLQAPAEEPVLVVQRRLLEAAPQEDVVAVERLEVVDALHQQRRVEETAHRRRREQHDAADHNVDVFGHAHPCAFADERAPVGSRRRLARRGSSAAACGWGDPATSARAWACVQVAFELGDAPALSDAELDAFARSSGAGDGGGGAHRAQLALAELRHTIERRTRDAAARAATPNRERADKVRARARKRARTSPGSAHAKSGLIMSDPRLCSRS